MRVVQRDAEGLHWSWWAGAAVLVHGLLLVALPLHAADQETHAGAVWLESAAIMDAQPIASNAAPHDTAAAAPRTAQTSKVHRARTVRRNDYRARAPEPSAYAGPTNASATAGVPAPEPSATTSGGAGQPTHEASSPSGRATRPPALLTLTDPCAGYYPAGARTDRGEARVVVEVDAAGRTLRARVLAESPAGHGFGGAARACAALLRFAPALDANGAPAPGEATLALRFARKT